MPNDTKPTTDSPPPPPSFPAEARVISETALRRPFQFSLKSLLVATAVVAVICGLWVALPTSISQILAGAVWIVASSWIAAGLLFARGDKQAFCLGAAIVITTTWTGIGGRFMGGVHGFLYLLFGSISPAPLALIDLVVLAVAAFGNGYLCILARRYFQRTK